MKPVYEVDYKNNVAKIYHCDNLNLLLSMPDESVALIYGDILFNTKTKKKDYDDNKWKSASEAIAWYSPRLKEFHRILKNNGSIYIHCDENLVHYLKVEMDKIFGTDNFLRDIIWRMGWVSGYKCSANNWIRNHDNILFYSKSKNYLFNKQYRRKDKSSGKIINYSIEDTWNCSDFDVLNSINIMSFHQKVYDTQKPKPLLERIIKASSNENDMVADFFMGSGTSGVEAVKLNRSFIGCDISERAIKISMERIEHEIINNKLTLFH